MNGWLREAIDENGYAVTLHYDAAGSKTGTTDNQGRQLWSGTVVYGIAPFTVNTTDSALGTRSYTFDALGEVTAYSDGNGNNFSASYDPLSRPLTRTEPDLFTQWTYGSSAGSFKRRDAWRVYVPEQGPIRWRVRLPAIPRVRPTTTRHDSRSAPLSFPTQAGAAETFNYGYQYNTSGLLSTLTYPATTGTPLQLSYTYGNGILSSIADVSDSPNVTLWTANASDGRRTADTGDPRQWGSGNSWF